MKAIFNCGIKTLWNAFFLENIYKVGKIVSACIINANEELYIVTSNNTCNYISFLKIFQSI